jgi:hypothetical protein
MASIEFRPKGRITLVRIEIVILSIIAAMWFKNKYSWEPYSTLISGVVAAIIIGVLFFGLSFFRYIFSAIFSLLWGFLAFQLAEGMTDSITARWVTFGLITVFSLVMHKDYFNFERRR